MKEKWEQRKTALEQRIKERQRVTCSSKRTLNEDAYLGIVPTPSPIILLLSLSRPPILRANPKYPKRQTC
jgi:hypothetical protein